MIGRLVLFVVLILSTSLAGKTNKTVSIKAKQVGNVIVVKAKNQNPFSISLYYNASYKNLESNHKLPAIFVLKPHSTQEIVRFKIKGKATYKGNAKWIMGSVKAKHNDRYIYGLPYKFGSKRRVTQGFNGRFSHNKVGSKYAVDFAMPEGTEILAAREGVIVLTENQYFKSGFTSDFATKGNVIVIEHNDGTLAMYGHLYRYGILVHKGQYVKKGELIAYSGNTGMSTGPHLHFAVFKVTNAKKLIKTIPFRFKSDEGVVKKPVRGKWYTAK